MFENFDFSWFLTTPGILTGLGCLLILISIIIFISSLRGGKKNKNINENGNNVQPAAVGEIQPTQVTQQAAPVDIQPIQAAPEAAPVEVQPTQVAPEVTPVEIQPIQVAPEGAPVEIQPTQVAPEVTPVEPSYSGINIEPSIKPITPENTVSQPYGGVSPTVGNINIPTEEPKVIYGGADPLAGTGIMPTINQSASKAEEIESL